MSILRLGDACAVHCSMISKRPRASRRSHTKRIFRGSMSPFARLHSLQARTVFVAPRAPPFDNGMKWSRVAVLGALGSPWGSTSTPQ
ncbi:protein of unknown function [Candidatus Filomicrobium marinum]|nr:protein of unknown function [Candidatus Filomicrobium marinum]